MDTSDTPNVIPYASPRARADWTISLFVFCGVLGLISIGLDQIYVMYFDQLLEGVDVDMAKIEANDNRYGILAIIAVVAYLGTVISFCMWFHRVYRNLPALGAPHLEFTPGWVVGYFFIPILNLFRPYQATREIAVYSDPTYAGTKSALQLGGPAFIKWWWALYIINESIARLSLRYSLRAEELEELRISSLLDMASSVVDIIATIAVIMVILRITRHQEDRYLSIRQFGPTPQSADGGTANEAAFA